jgi:saccharopine dehydrogenase-like NADP-dependent oxidoreductase
MMRVVVIGGLGNFGARICRRLAPDPRFTVIATSRRMSIAEGPRGIQVATLDIANPGFGSDLQSLAPDLVIHCAGPFQGQDYRVALASAACRAHYIDLSDGREFVTGFVKAVGPAAQAAGRLAVTGASTLPALSSAVVDSFATAFSTLNSIDVIIAPGQHALRGTATVTAVLGYAGQAIPWWQHGRWGTTYGWQDLKRENFSFGSRLAAACDVPDLELLPQRYAGVQSVTFRAALEVSLQHFGLWLMSACRRIGIPLPLARLGASMDRVGTWLNWLGTWC